MLWTVRAGLAAALLNCAMSTGFGAPVADTNVGPNSGPQIEHWLRDPATACALFDADAQAGDTVRWTGACIGDKADGLGTAIFTHDGQEQSFTASFTQGVIPDGHVTTRWGAGWSYDGETVEGRFNGAGILTTDKTDRFEGQWTDGKMNGFGVLRRANGERYAGDWKDDKPNGQGELRHADGTRVAGQFVDGKLMQKAAPVALKDAATPQNAPQAAPFGGVSGKTLTGVDGSSIALNLIEGGMELQVMPGDTGQDAAARKTTFTFMTDRMGTVVEDTGAPGAGTSVTGFFRLTGKGVEVRYADGRSTMLSANSDGGVQMALDGDAGASCRNWYPAGHSFSDAEKKAALNAYAGRLGLAMTAAGSSSGCSATPVAANAAPPPVASLVPTPAVPAPKARPERHAEMKLPTRIAKASYRIGDFAGNATSLRAGLESVAVKTSEIHLIDGDDARTAPTVKEMVAAPGDRNNASRCLKVDSDGGHWGFRNACDFAVQFAYCMAGGSDSLTACGSGTAPASIAGSVAAGGFGALMADNSLKDKGADHNFRWIACGGGAGEVVAHLEHFEPPGGRCERTRTASAN